MTVRICSDWPPRVNTRSLLEREAVAVVARFELMSAWKGTNGSEDGMRVCEMDVENV